MSVFITGTDMPKGCHECQKFLDGDDYCIIQDLAMTGDEWDKYTFDKQYKNCPLKSVEGLIEKVEQLKKSCANDSYGKCMTNAISRVEKLIKEYCEEEQKE